MNYQTYQDFGFTKLNQSDFDKVVNDSQTLIDNLTRDYYQINNVEDDLTSRDTFKQFKAKQYQKAICLQCEFANELGASSLLGQQQASLTGVTIGRTHIEQGGNVVNLATYGKSGVSKVAASMLSRTGLLYRGVDSH